MHRGTNLLCLILSLLLHAGLVASAVGLVQSVPSTTFLSPSDPWMGDTFDVDTVLIGGESAGSNVVEGIAAPKPAVESRSEPDTAQPDTAQPDTAQPDTAQPDTAQPEPVPEPKVAAANPKPAQAPTLPPASVSPRPKASAASAHPSRTSPVALPAPAAGAAAGAGAERSSGGSSPGSFGAAGQRRGVRNLATAFARAMPIANSGDPFWASKPLGPAGSMNVTIEVNDDGKVVSAKPTDPRRAPEHLVRLVERTLSLLRAGRFSLSRADTAAGQETYHLEAAIDRVEDAPSDDLSNAGPYALGFRAPKPNQAGHATFTLRSGRRITITIRLLTKSP